MNTRLKLILFAVPFVLLDLITKSLAMGKDISVVNDILKIKYAINTGGTFSLLTGYNWLFVIISIGIIIFFLIFSENLDKVGFSGFVLILSGAFGNLIDRLVYGYVRDFIDFGFFPTFNLADVFLSVGVVLVVLYWRRVRN